ncbi:MAG: TRAP transporter small permease subunit [Propionibacteriales bacterium]|nr:TRAP transporter small permease subunit [Propionibacteriales bacterium]
MTSPATGSSDLAGTTPVPAPSGLASVDRIAAKVSVIFAVVGCVLLGALALLVVADIIGRLFGQPVAGTVQITATSVVAIAFLFMPFTVRQRGHVRSTIIRNRLPQGGRNFIDSLAYAIGALVFAMIFFSSLGVVVESWTSGEYEGEGVLRVPEFPTRAILALSSAAMVLECVLATIRSVKSAEEPEA